MVKLDYQIVYRKGTKIRGKRKLLSRTDLMVGDKNYEVKIYFSTPLPPHLITRIGSVYDREVCVIIEAMHMKYAEITPSIITLDLYVLPGVPVLPAGKMMDAFAVDAVFEGWPVAMVEIYEIIPVKVPWGWVAFCLGSAIVGVFLGLIVVEGAKRS